MEKRDPYDAGHNPEHPGHHGHPKDAPVVPSPEVAKPPDEGVPPEGVKPESEEKKPKEVFKTTDDSFDMDEERENAG